MEEEAIFSLFGLILSLFMAVFSHFEYACIESPVEFLPLEVMPLLPPLLLQNSPIDKYTREFNTETSEKIN